MYFRILLLTGSLLAAPAAAAEEPTYERDVRPILKTNCFRCHGEGEQLEGGLDLRLQRLISRGGDSGPAIMPGDSAASVLFQRIRDGEMPPPEIEKRLTAAEIETIARWISSGGKTLRKEPADADPSRYVTEEERQFWAFQPVSRPSPPAVRDPSRIRSPVDRFVLARLESAGLTFSEDADAGTLLRRVYFDLWGLPPTPDETAAFVADRSPDAYERLIDRLLASPHYGERWGRHWLDAAGYADSEGYHDDDSLRPDAWKYRDYVLHAFNNDKPYDEFVVEQLAGDELIGRDLTNLSAAEADVLVATGFLRMAPDGTASSGVDQGVARNEVMAKTLDIVSTSLLGLTVGCAQCHNHRYDPISQEDYYALRAVFEPALDWKNWRNPTARRVSLYSDDDRRRASEIEEEAKRVESERAKKQAEFIEQTLVKELAKLPAELHASIREARDTPASKQSAAQKRLLQQHPSVNVSAGSLYLYDSKAADELKRMADEATQIRQRKPKEEFVRAFWEPTNRPAPPTYFFVRGQFDQPKQQLEPRPLTILAVALAANFPPDDPMLPTTGRRLALARWLTDKRHPLTSRVMINRVWLHHFGRGLVETPGDFGYLGGRPTHPELLDWLAHEFSADAWSLKQMHRVLLTSTTYRQAARQRDNGQAIDPDNRLYWRMFVRRNEAEVLRDSILAVSGRLNTKAYGAPVPVMADNVGQFVVGIENLNAGRPGAVLPLHGEEFRRSIYIQMRRSRPLSVLEPFDMPRMEPNCTKRASSTVAPQSLLLMNNDFVTEAASAFAKRVGELAERDVLSQVRWVWRYAYAVEPTDAELGDSVQFILDQATYLAAHPPAVMENTPAKTKKAAAEPPRFDPQREALVTYCHAVLSSNRFLYVD